MLKAVAALARPITHSYLLHQRSVTMQVHGRQILLSSLLLSGVLVVLTGGFFAGIAVRKGRTAVSSVRTSIEWPSRSRAHGRGVAEFVIQISIDGAGSSCLQRLIDYGQLPNFKRLETEGAWTFNARTDFDVTITLPNHTCMLTGRPVHSKGLILGHQWTDNHEPADLTLHSNARSYVSSAFDVAHDNGFSTALYASKAKFVLFQQSYDERSGAPDRIGDDDGRNKIDMSVLNDDTAEMMHIFVSNMAQRPANYSFVHIRDADTAGHAYGWGSEPYVEAMKQADGYLGMVFDLVVQNPTLNGKTTIILTADHGGFRKNHVDSSHPLAYTVPFFVWGAGAAKAADLYSLNGDRRSDPGTSRVDYSAFGLQPIRNGDAGNLALRLLGLAPIPGSSINVKQDLVTDNGEQDLVADNGEQDLAPEAYAVARTN